MGYNKTQNACCLTAVCVYVRGEREGEGETRRMKGEYVKMKMDKEREAKETKKKQGETKRAIHSQNQNCIGGRGACCKRQSKQDKQLNKRKL